MGTGPAFASATEAMDMARTALGYLAAADATALAYTAWVRRAAAHPEVAAALAAGQISESFARTLCAWTGRLPADTRPVADEILLAAAGQGLDLRGLAELAAEMLARAEPGKPDQDAAFEDRAVRLETTFDGAG